MKKNYVKPVIDNTIIIEDCYICQSQITSGDGSVSVDFGGDATSDMKGDSKGFGLWEDED